MLLQWNTGCLNFSSETKSCRMKEKKNFVKANVAYISHFVTSYSAKSPTNTRLFL
uniref:Uncharacterized protein n=1 Tax=Solanum tuberosum TaxID=4113 RepID=M1D619_SOLTU